MSRSFSGTPNRLAASSSPVSAYSITLSAWFRPTTVSINQSVISVGTQGSSDVSRVELRVLSTNTLQARSIDSASGASSASVGTVSQNVWAHGAAVFVSNTSRVVYLNGSSGSNTTSRTVTPSTFAACTVGCNPTSSGSFGSFFEGDIAEVAIWAAELTTDEIAVLAAAHSPLFVRPQSLVFYAPLFGRAGADGNEEDWIGGLTLTQNSSPALADHPRIIYPRRRVAIPFSAAVAGFKAAWARQNSRVIGGGV